MFCGTMRRMPGMRNSITLLAATAFLGMPGPASACTPTTDGSFPYGPRGTPGEQIEMAEAVIDAEVLQPYIHGKQNGIIRAHRIFKGPDQETYEIAGGTTCDFMPYAEGERLRLFLFKSPPWVWMAAQLAEGSVPMAPGKVGVFYAREAPPSIDALLDSDRDEDWPYYPGGGEQWQPEPPTPLPARESP